MKYHKIYTVTAVCFLVVFSGFLCKICFWPGPQVANAGSAPQPVQAEQPLNEDGRIAVVNFADSQNVDGQMDTGVANVELLSIGNSVGENSIIQISPDDSDSAYHFASIGDSGTGSDTSASLSQSSLLSSLSSSSSSVSTTASDSGASSSGSSSSSGVSGSSSSSSSGSGGSSSSGTSSSASSGTGSSGSSGGGSSASTANNTATIQAASMAGGGGGVVLETELEKIKKLSPLPKVHYSWGLDLNEDIVDNRDSELLYHFARITRSVSVSTSPHHTRLVLAKRVDNAVYTCARINKTNPDIPCTIALGYSPWHWKFIPKVELNKYNYAVFSHPTYQAEIDEFVEQMTFLKQQIEQWNQFYDSDVSVSAILLNTERFSPRKHDSYWNEGMAKALDDIHEEAIKLFPEARIEWYMRGMGGYTAASLSERYSYFTTLEKYKPTLSYNYYVAPDVEFMRQVFRKTCELADSLGVQEVTPWLGLAWGRKHEFGKVVFEAWDYDIQYSYQAGQKLNDFCKGRRPTHYPPYQRVGVVVLYTPFDPDLPDYGKHFVEYCKGAAAANP